MKRMPTVKRNERRDRCVPAPPVELSKLLEEYEAEPPASPPAIPPENSAPAPPNDASWLNEAELAEKDAAATAGAD